MNIDRAIMRFAGTVVLLSVLLGVFVSPYWFLLTGFAGLNLLQASFTGFCPIATLFKKFGLKSGPAF